MDATLSINLLGSPAIRLDDAPVRGFVSSKAAALLYYLAATGRTHSREALAGLLWPETSDAQASKNLRDVLSNLRRLLSPYLLIERRTVCLNPHAVVIVDSRRFEGCLASLSSAAPPDGESLLREAARLYRGDLLEGFALHDAPAFEEWLLLERERLHQLALNALHSLAHAAAERGAYQEGIDYAARLLAMDPNREEAHRQMMLLLALSGQRGAALVQYETCRRILDNELGLDPDEATAALHRRILDGEITPAGIALPSAPPRLRHNLPIAPGPLVGRAVECERLLGYLRDPACRLVTLTGPGGAGKTRLALEAAHALLPDAAPPAPFPDGVFLVVLTAFSPLAAPDNLLATAIASAMGLVLSSPDAPLAQVMRVLQPQQLLLVLDNCEDLPGATSLIAALLRECPRLRILATSRDRLDLRSERVITVAGLPLPDEDERTAHEALDASRVMNLSVPLATLERSDAVQFFVQAARATTPDFALTTETGPPVARICRMVGGLPLGIELAASWTAILSCDEIALEIAHNLDFLSAEHHDRPARQQSLRAVFASSWDLLTAHEQQVLQCLSVFRGNFTRAAAEQVTGAKEYPGPTSQAVVLSRDVGGQDTMPGSPAFAPLAMPLLPILAGLINKSLVRRVGTERGIARYDLLEPLRQYAAEQLAWAGKTAATAARHCRYYLAWLAAHTSDLRGPRQQEALQAIGTEIAEIRAAWQQAVADGAGEIIRQAADALFHFYSMRSWFQEGAEVFLATARALEARPTDAVSVRAWGNMLARTGWCVFQLGHQEEARALLEQSLAVLRPLALPEELIIPLNYLASLTRHSGAYDNALALAREGLELSMALDDRYGVSISTTNLSQIYRSMDRYAEARWYAEESLRLERELGNAWGSAFSLTVLGQLAFTVGEYGAARRALQEALAIRSSLNDLRGMAFCLNALGDISAALDDAEAASWCYTRSLTLFRSIGNQWGTAETLLCLAHLAAATGRAADATALFEEALAIAQRIGATQQIAAARAALTLPAAPA